MTTENLISPPTHSVTQFVAFHHNTLMPTLLKLSISLRIKAISTAIAANLRVRNIKISLKTVSIVQSHLAIMDQVIVPEKAALLKVTPRRRSRGLIFISTTSTNVLLTAWKMAMNSVLAVKAAKPT